MVASPATPPVAPGTFLAGTGGTFMDSMDGFAITNNTVLTPAPTNTATITTAVDPATGQVRFLTLNIPLGGGNSYMHMFDLVGSTIGAPGAALAGFLAKSEGAPLSDGNLPHNIILDPTLDFSTYGVWVNENSDTMTGSTGAFAFGNMTPQAGIPTTGTATYSGKTIGTGFNKTAQSVSVLVGTASITADFKGMMVSGSFIVNDATKNVLWGNLSMPLTSIATATGGAYNGSLTLTSGTLEAGDTIAASDVHGHFYGPTANETAGTWSVTGMTTWQAFGGFGAKKQ